jgi:hypothetical protein
MATGVGSTVVVSTQEISGMAAMAEELVVETVAERLRDEETRACTLDALEALPAASGIPRELGLVVAPALVDVAVETVDRGDFDRSTLLLGRLMEDGAPDPSAVYGAACGGERLAAFFAPRLVVEAMQRALGGGGADGGGLTREDAYSIACWEAWLSPASVRGQTAPFAAAANSAMEWFRTVSRVFCC